MRASASSDSVPVSPPVLNFGRFDEVAPAPSKMLIASGPSAAYSSSSWDSKTTSASLIFIVTFIFLLTQTVVGRYTRDDNRGQGISAFLLLLIPNRRRASRLTPAWRVVVFLTLPHARQVCQEIRNLFAHRTAKRVNPTTKSLRRPVRSLRTPFYLVWYYFPVNCLCVSPFPSTPLRTFTNRPASLSLHSLNLKAYSSR